MESIADQMLEQLGCILGDFTLMAWIPNEIIFEKMVSELKPYGSSWLSKRFAALGVQSLHKLSISSGQRLPSHSEYPQLA